MVGIYMSGTGNTKHCLTKLVGMLDREAELVPIEREDAAAKIAEQDLIYLAYPTQFSNVPYMVKDFIQKNPEIWKGKRVFCLVTKGAFSGDVTGCAARVLKKYGAQVVGGLQVKMPDSVCDSKMLKKTAEENKKIIREADEKLVKTAEIIRSGGAYPQEGLSFFAHLAGLFGQRLWFYGKTKNYSKKLKISDACVGCALCAKNCPMKNLSIQDGKAVCSGKCAMCYRCISTCPKQAITLLGKKVVEQTRYEKFAGEDK